MSFPLLFNRRRTGGPSYDVHDDFTDERAAGALDGTPPTPGPGDNRSLTAGNQFSSTGGELVITDQGAWEHLREGSHSREFGKSVIIRFTSPSGNVVYALGTSDGSSNSDQAMSYQSPGNAAKEMDVLANNSKVADDVIGLAASTDYNLAITERATGAYYFWLVNGSYLLLWVDSTATDGTI